MVLSQVLKKLAEACFLLDKIAEQECLVLGERESFDYYLSAFLTAAMSVRGGFHYRQNPKRNQPIKAWRAQCENNLSRQERSLYEFMREERVAEVHHSGSSRSVGQEGIECGIGEHRLPGGLFSVFGPPGMPPVVIPKPTYNFTIDGAERRATEVCGEYLALLRRMVAEFEAARP